jgi:hypothetical protein
VGAFKEAVSLHCPGLATQAREWNASARDAGGRDLRSIAFVLAASVAVLIVEVAFGGGDTAATIVASIARRLHRSERALCGGASLEAGEILSDLLAEFWSNAADRADLLG